LLAQRIVAKADRRIRHAHVTGAGNGTVVFVQEPNWLHHERRLADMPAPGSPLQPLKLDPEAIIPSTIPPFGEPALPWRDPTSRQEHEGDAPVE
jgi:hypothetical protein